MTQYVLTCPMIITSRLMPGARIGESTISIAAVESDGYRDQWTYYIDTPEGELYHASDITTARIANDTWGDRARLALSTLCSFLGAEAESYRATMGASEPADGWLFDAATAEWAYLNDDEISMLRCDLDSE